MIKYFKYVIILSLVFSSEREDSYHGGWPIKTTKDKEISDINCPGDLGCECSLNEDCQNGNCAKHLKGYYCSLEKEDIFFINEKQVLPEQEGFLRDYFTEKVNPALVTLILLEEQKEDFTHGKGFLLVRMELVNDRPDKLMYALIEIPKEVDRFVVLPKSPDGKQYVMMLDDLIRYHFNVILDICG